MFFLFGIFNGCSLVQLKKCQTFTIKKNWRSQNFDLIGKKIWEMHYLWKYKVYSGKRLFWHYRLQLSFVYKTVSRFLLICFDWEIKGFYQSFLGNEVDFTDIMNLSPNICLKIKISKNRHNFVDKRTLITTSSTSSCHWKTLVPFCLWKKRPENAFLTLIVNYRKIVEKNKLCHSKQH